MKISYRWISLILALCVALSMLSACNLTNDGDAEKESATENVDEFLPDVEKNNYNSDFYLWIMDDTNKPGYHWVEESSNDVLSEAIYVRQQRVYDYLGVEIVGVVREENYLNYTEPFKTAVKNKDGSVNMMLCHVFSGVPSLVSENYLTDVSSLSGVDVDADYWNREFMEDLSVAGKYYLGFSDFNILYTHVITFNKDMMDHYSDVLDKNVYDMVRDYEWTIDEMISLASLVYIDKTANGKTPDDTFGITGRHMNEFPGFLHACDIKIIEMNESGKYTVALMNDLYAERTSALVDKLLALSASDCSYFDYNTTTGMTVPLSTGRTLLHVSPTLELVGYLQHDIPFGVLPYPMWDTAQKDIGYRHLQWGGYITVPAYLKDEQMTGETLEMLAYYSEDVKTAYYEKMLGKQVADIPDDREMLSIVWDTVCTDFAQTYCDVAGGSELLYLMAKVTDPANQMNLASSVAGLTRTTNKSISAFITKIEHNSKQ